MDRSRNTYLETYRHMSYFVCRVARTVSSHVVGGGLSRRPRRRRPGTPGAGR